MHFRRNTSIIIILKTLLNKTHYKDPNRKTTAEFPRSDSLQDEVKLWSSSETRLTSGNSRSRHKHWIWTARRDFILNSSLRRTNQTASESESYWMNEQRFTSQMIIQIHLLMRWCYKPVINLWSDLHTNHRRGSWSRFDWFHTNERKRTNEHSELLILAFPFLLKS